MKRPRRGEAHRLSWAAELVRASFECHAFTRGQLDPDFTGPALITDRRNRPERDNGSELWALSPQHITETRPRGRSSCPIPPNAYQLTKVKRTVEEAPDWMREVLKGLVAGHGDDFDATLAELESRFLSRCRPSLAIRNELKQLHPAVLANVHYDLVEQPRITLPDAAVKSGVSAYYERQYDAAWRKKIDKSVGAHWSALHEVGGNMVEEALKYVLENIPS